ncbi:HAD family hydrolase [Actinosynnema sp. NPDC050436]|uniref:HAD family hydrolase n=1 Tax=Actinosynnema sp. NPDC050436 TaxID=3155659 RepID=UPI0033D283B7
MERPALVASDVDGTLLSPLHRVTDRTAAAVGRVVAAGVPFVLATGRPPRWVPDIAEAAGLDGYAVCANGAVLYHLGQDRVIWQRTLDPVLLRDIMSALDEVMPGVAFAVERTGESAFDETVPQFIAEDGYAHPWPEGPEPNGDRSGMLTHPVVKLLVRHREMTSGEMVLAIAELLGDQVDATYSTTLGLVELAAPGVTKATGLADVAERLGVDRAGVVAFGDMPNDVEMLGWAGHGVAMANGHPDARAAADEVTGPNGEDGVAMVLERWF